MLTTYQLTRKARLIDNITKALERCSEADTEMRDTLDTARLEVIDRYPDFNSKSSLPMTCPICGKTREVKVNNLYNMDSSVCLSCSTRSHQSCVTSAEVREKAETSRREGGYYESDIFKKFQDAGNSDESIQKMVDTKRKNGFYESDAFKAFLDAGHALAARKKAAATKFERYGTYWIIKNKEENES